MEKLNGYKEKKKIKPHKIIIGIFIAFILLLAVDYELIFSFNDTEYIITVTDKERIYEKDDDGDSSSKYLVFGDNENGDALVFENTDCFIRGKWNSSNVQEQLKEGNTYKIVVIGYRVPFLSMYQNIVKIEKIK